MALLKTCCYLLLLLRLINVCLSNNEALSKWMEVLETEAVFKNFIYILENSLNGQFGSIKNFCFNIPVTCICYRSNLISGYY